MSVTHIVTAVSVRNGRRTFCRADRVFSVAGTPVDRDEISEADWAELEGEPRLHIREARPDEVEAGGPRAAPQTGEELELLKAQVDEAIRILEPVDYGADGTPNLAPIRKLLPEQKARIDGPLRDAVWAEMTKGGFRKPEPAT